MDGLVEKALYKERAAVHHRGKDNDAAFEQTTFAISRRLSFGHLLLLVIQAEPTLTFLRQKGLAIIENPEI
jgi:hypothetical protein